MPSRPDTLILPSEYKHYKGIDDLFQTFLKRGARLWFYNVPAKKQTDFKAFLESFSDSTDANWSAEKTLGRMDDIQKYSNTTRKISASFKICAESEADAVQNLGKIGLLKRLLYPTFDDSGNFGNARPMNNPPLMRVKFGNIITKAGGVPNGTVGDTGLLCTVASVNLTHELQYGYFHPRQGEFYPRICSLQFSMTPIHEHELGWRTSDTSELDMGFRHWPNNVELNTWFLNDKIHATYEAVENAVEYMEENATWENFHNLRESVKAAQESGLNKLRDDSENNIREYTDRISPWQ